MFLLIPVVNFSIMFVAILTTIIIHLIIIVFFQVGQLALRYIMSRVQQYADDVSRSRIVQCSTL